MASRKPRAIGPGGKIGAVVVVCEDGTVWILKEVDNAFVWEEGPPIPDDGGGP